MLYVVAMSKKGSLGSDTVSKFLSVLVYTCDLLVLIIPVRPRTFNGLHYPCILSTLLIVGHVG